MTIQKRIQNLQPGDSMDLITTKFAATWVERSGDGTTLRFCRKIGETTTVYRTEKFV